MSAHSITALIMIARAAKAAMDNAAGDDSVESEDFDVLVNNFDQAVRALASAPTTTIEQVRQKAKFLLWIDTDEEGNQLRDTSFVTRFLTELAGRDFTDADAAHVDSNAPATLEASSAYKVGYRGFKRYVRLALTKEGGTSIAAGAVAVLSDAAQRPVA